MRSPSGATSISSSWFLDPCILFTEGTTHKCCIFKIYTACKGYCPIQVWNYLLIVISLVPSKGSSITLSNQPFLDGMVSDRSMVVYSLKCFLFCKVGFLVWNNVRWNFMLKVKHSVSCNTVSKAMYIHLVKMTIDTS